MRLVVLSVCVSVCPSVSLSVYTSLGGDMHFYERGRQRQLPPPLNSGYFTAIISCSVKTVADSHRHAAYQLL